MAVVVAPVLNTWIGAQSSGSETDLGADADANVL